MSTTSTKNAVQAKNISDLAGELAASIISNMRKINLRIGIDYLEHKGRLVIEGTNEADSGTIKYEIGRYAVRGPNLNNFKEYHGLRAVAVNIDEDFSLHDFIYDKQKGVYFKPQVPQ